MVPVGGKKLCENVSSSYFLYANPSPLITWAGLCPTWRDKIDDFSKNSYQERGKNSTLAPALWQLFWLLLHSQLGDPYLPVELNKRAPGCIRTPAAGSAKDQNTAKCAEIKDSLSWCQHQFTWVCLTQSLLMAFVPPFINHSIGFGVANCTKLDSKLGSANGALSPL